MTSIGYIIATYSGKTRNSGLELQFQFEQLYKKCRQSLIKRVQEIIVVIPPPRGDFYMDYYQLEKWEPKFLEHGIKLSCCNYTGSNTCFSYDQWIQGYLFSPNHDYYIIIEDDYYFSGSDQNLLEIYQLCFPDKLGYLATFAGCYNSFIHHAAISNGMISKETWESIPNLLSTYYNLPYMLKQTLPAHLGGKSQIGFSLLWTSAGIPIKDFREYASAIFWCSNRKVLIDYSLKLGLPSIFSPYQAQHLQTETEFLKE